MRRRELHGSAGLTEAARGACPSRPRASPAGRGRNAPPARRSVGRAEQGTPLPPLAERAWRPGPCARKLPRPIAQPRRPVVGDPVVACEADPLGVSFAFQVAQRLGDSLFWEPGGRRQLRGVGAAAPLHGGRGLVDRPQHLGALGSAFGRPARRYPDVLLADGMAGRVGSARPCTYPPSSSRRPVKTTSLRFRSRRVPPAGERRSRRDGRLTLGSYTRPSRTSGLGAAGV